MCGKRIAWNLQVELPGPEYKACGRALFMGLAREADGIWDALADWKYGSSGMDGKAQRPYRAQKQLSPHWVRMGRKAAWLKSS